MVYPPSLKNDVYQFAGNYLAPYRRSGDELKARLCPICHGGDNQDEYTFSINAQTGLANCLRGSCGWKGTIKDLADMYGYTMTSNRTFATPAKKKLHAPEVELVPLTDECIAYLETRKISKDTMDAFRLASDKQGNIVFPFYKDEKLTFVKYRKPHKPLPKEPKEWQERDTQPVLFGMDQCVFSQPLVITEGQIDALAVYEAGYPNVVSVPCGCNNFDWVDPCWEWLEKFNDIILFGDNDDPGRQMVQDLSKKLGVERCRIVENYPVRDNGVPCKDANEVLYFHGELEIMDMIESASEIPIRGAIDLADVVPVDPTTVPRIATDIPELDEILGGLVLPGITVITGKSGSGKSTIGGTFLLNAIEQGYNVCAYSGELSKEKFQTWINFQCAGSDYITLKYDPIKRKEVPHVPLSVVQRLLDYYRGRFFLFDNKTEDLEDDTLGSVMKVFTMMARRHNVKLFLIDNVMTMTMGSESEENAAQGRLMNILKKFTIMYDCHVILVAHLRKTKAGESARQDDISGNSVIAKLADNAMVIQHPDINVIKNRDEGVMKVISCGYEPDSRRIYQLDKGDLYKYSWDKTGLPLASPRADSKAEYKEQIKCGDNPF